MREICTSGSVGALGADFRGYPTLLGCPAAGPLQNLLWRHSVPLGGCTVRRWAGLETSMSWLARVGLDCCRVRGGAGYGSQGSESERRETYDVVSSQSGASRRRFSIALARRTLVPEISVAARDWATDADVRGRMRHSLSCGDGRAAREACFVRFALDGIYGDGSQDVAGRFESRRSSRSFGLGAVIE